MFAFRPSIKGRVLSVIKARLAEAQEALNGEIEVLEQTAMEARERIEQNLRDDVDAATEKHVNSILSKIL